MASFLAALALASLPGGDLERLEAVDDAQTRAQYAVYTRNAAALRAAHDDLEGFAASQDRAPLAWYYIGYIEFRLAQLEQEQEAAADHLERCIEHAAIALKQEPRLAEAHALTAVCRRLQSDRSPLKAMLPSRGASGHLRKARELAPQNPRVELLAAIDQYHRPRDGADPQAAAPTFRRALYLFEKENGTEADGARAEAHAYLGSLYLANGDVMRARNELEQALLIAPEYAWARELMASIQAPPE